MIKLHHFSVVVEVDYGGGAPCVLRAMLDDADGPNDNVFSDANGWENADVDPETWDGDQAALTALSEMLR